MTDSVSEKTGKSFFISLIILIAASILVVILGFLSFQSQKEYIKNSAKHQLTAIADLKVSEINNWQKERTGDASVIYFNRAFASNVSQYLDDPYSVTAKENILSLLTAIEKAYRYKNLLLLDRNRKVVLSLHKYDKAFSQNHSALIDEATQKKEIIFGDFHKDKEAGEVHLSIAIPVIISKSNNKTVIGCVMMIIDPHLHLYPMIKSWPVPSSSGETLLVHREGDDVVYLNVLRHLKNMPMEIKRSINESEMPAVMAVLGQRGVVEGTDYRHKKVLAAIQPVPGSPWFLVSKIDEDEVFAPVVTRFWVTLFFVVIIIATLGLIFAYIRRHQQANLSRRKLELEERERSLYARSLIEASLDPLVTINTGGKIMDVNKSTESVTGLSRDELIGSDFSSLFTEPKKAEEGYKLAFMDGIVRDYPLAIRNVAGQITEVLYNAAVYKDNSGAVQGVFAAARDVTELKRVQRELKAAHDDLEERVKYRTIELQKANEALEMEIRERKEVENLIILRTRLLEMTNKELESFSYSVSHDLRAPLRAIDGYSRMILRDHADTLSSETKRRFELIRSNTHVMGKLIDDLLSFSRLGRMEINMSRLDMEGLINDVWKELQIINPGGNYALIIKDIPESRGDRTLIKQVYSNLLSNAVKYTKFKNKAYIEAGGYTGGNENIYYIKDNGVGFDMSYYDKLFGVFQRLHSADDYEGTGVGLAIVQRIIQRHGGRVWAEGKVDDGATFYFSLQREE
ncbi:MAG TPA: ATP-binding protein [Smithella sp.]|nr:ATP-binding protein [Smithella sp.]